MNSLPEHEPENEPENESAQDTPRPESSGEAEEAHASASEPANEWNPATEPLAAPAVHEDPVFDGPFPGAGIPAEPSPVEPPLFQSFSQPVPRPPVRLPHLGHLLILGVFASFALLCVAGLLSAALHFHLWGIATQQQAATDIHYNLGSEAILYLVTFGVSLLFFPLIWHKSLMAGLQWNGAIALSLRKRLLTTASICFALALVNGFLLPGPENAPIDKMFRTPGAAWLLFGFGVAVAPFFEEMFFRGFLLPALCTACDWVEEKTTHAPVRPLDQTGQPQWSLTAMVISSIATSIPFAFMHAEQTGYSWGPFFLLVGVSLVLCWTRLSTRSLAASVMVHASYNFLLFSIMLIGTDGFRHLDKM